MSLLSVGNGVSCLERILRLYRLKGVLFEDALGEQCKVVIIMI